MSRPLLLAIGLFGLVLGLAVSVRNWPPVTAADQEQPRYDQAAPVPHGTVRLSQSFRAHENGLSAIELLAVVYPDSGGEGDPQPQLILSLRDSGGRLVAEQAYTGLAHNAPIHFSFPPQPGSAGQTYTLELSGTAGNVATVWAYSLDGYASGALLAEGASTGGDLRFTTRYTYLWRDWLGDGLAAWERVLTMAVPLWLLLFAPGLLLLDSLDSRHLIPASAWTRWGVALALSVGLLALLWLWIGVLGFRWAPWSLGLVYAIAGAVVVRRALLRAWPGAGERQRNHLLLAGSHLAQGPQSLASEQLTAEPALPEGGPSATRSNRAPWGYDIGVALVLAAGLTLRFLAARDVALPLWVDSSHHALIVRLLAETGRVPEGYGSLLPINTFIYHFGYHALAASLDWFTQWPLPEVMLLLGQVLNGLMPLSIYALVWLVTARRRAALIAAFVVAVISFFPAYYVTWGRYTQLVGLLVLAPLLGLLWRALGWPGRQATRRQQAATAVLLGVTVAGLFLAHYRVLLFFFVFATTIAVAQLRRSETWKGLAAAVILSSLLTWPWIARLFVLAVRPLVEAPAGLAAGEAYNAFPVEYFHSWLERGWLGLAGLAWLWALLRREAGVVLTGLSALVVLALLALLPAMWLVNTNSWAISLFVPAALLLGWGADRWLQWGQELLSAQSSDRLPALTHRLRAVAGGLMLSLAVAGAVYGILRGVPAQVAIVNPATVLATAADRAALAWVDRHTPRDAVFLVNGWEWLNGIWAGSDGAAWLLPLTGRAATLPPINYASGDSAWRAQVEAFNREAQPMAEAAPAERHAWLQGAGVTHVFIGARGGLWQPEHFAGDPRYRLLFTNGAAWVFEVISAPAISR